MAESFTLEVEGLQETLRAFGRIEKGLKRELGVELKKVAGLVAIDARAIAESKGLRASGKLIASIRPGLRGSVAYVTATARRKSPKYPAGFNYPAVFEYGAGGARAFLHPAAEAGEAKVLFGVEGLLDRLTSDAGFGVGGRL